MRRNATSRPRKPSVQTSPFGSVGDRDVAAAAYMDVLAAVPKGLVCADGACDTLNEALRNAAI